MGRSKQPLANGLIVGHLSTNLINLQKRELAPEKYAGCPDPKQWVLLVCFYPDLYLDI